MLRLGSLLEVRREGEIRVQANLKHCVLRISCSPSPIGSRRELTPVLCSVRLSWRRRARPSTTLHEIQICGEADWNNYL